MSAGVFPDHSESQNLLKLQCVVLMCTFQSITSNKKCVTCNPTVIPPPQNIAIQNSFFVLYVPVSHYSLHTLDWQSNNTYNAYNQLFPRELVVTSENINTHIKCCMTCCQSLEFDYPTWVLMIRKDEKRERVGKLEGEQTREMKLNSHLKESRHFLIFYESNWFDH